MNIKLVKNYNQIRPDRATLFCFPFAGGGASAYNSWVQKMKDKVTVCPIQLPGREERIMEKPYNNMTDMLDELEETIWKCIRGPYAFWGHSMGGKIAYELEKRLEKRGKTAQCFLVSGSRIPSIPERNPIYHLPDDEFKKALGRFEYENLEGWEKLSLGMQLDKWAIRYGNRIAVTDSEEEITYSELNQKAIGTGQYFMEKGIQKGDKVLVQLPNRISFVVVLFALAKIGAVPIMMLPAHRETELEGIIALAKPSAYIVAERYLGFYYVEMAMAMQKKFPCIQNVFVDGTQRGAWYEAETERQGVFPEVDSYSTAVLLLSGGTTGVPKLIPRTHTDYMYNARMSAKRCQLDESSVYLAALPVAHNFPLCCPGLLGTFDIGGKVVLAPTTSPDDILTAITEEKVTITALVPAMVTVCMEMLEYDEDYDISSLKILQVGGAMLEDSLADKIIEEWPCTLMQVFGTAEGLLSFTSPDDDVTVIARCQGTPVSPADEVKIVDENDEEVPTGVFGELLSRGPYTIDGYYMAEETNRTSFTEDGFYRTGDKAMWTGKGHLRMGGRIKEQINRAGEKIMPAEIEAYLCKHSDIKEAAVVGVPDETLGNRICAFILTEKGNALDVQAVHQFLKEIGVASYKLPDQVEIIEKWPLTSVGKVDKKVLVQMAQEKRGDYRDGIQ